MNGETNVGARKFPEGLLGARRSFGGDPGGFLDLRHMNGLDFNHASLVPVWFRLV